MVKGLCEEQGLTRKALAEKAGIAEATVWRIVHNAGEVKIKTLEKVVEALGVDMDYICDEEREMKELSAEEKICKAYKRKGLTLREVTVKTGICGETVTKAKQDIFSVEHESLCKLAVFLGLDAQKLYDGEMERIRNADLAQKIKMLCKRKGITQKEFAKLLEIDQSALDYALNGRRTQIGIRTYMKWAKVLDVPVDVFCSEEAMIQQALMQETVGKRIEKVCEVKGITLRELAKLSGLGYSTLSDIKRDKSISTKRSTMMKIADALNLSFDELANGI